jgi:hypothetical protein
MEQHPKSTEDHFVGKVIQGVSYSEKQEAGQAIIAACKSMTSPDPIQLGEFRDFDLELSFNSFERTYEVRIKGDTTQSVALGDDVFGNITRIDNRIVASLNCWTRQRTSSKTPNGSLKLPRARCRNRSRRKKT